MKNLDITKLNKMFNLLQNDAYHCDAVDFVSEEIDEYNNGGWYGCYADRGGVCPDFCAIIEGRAFIPSMFRGMLKCDVELAFARILATKDIEGGHYSALDASCNDTLPQALKGEYAFTTPGQFKSLLLKCYDVAQAAAKNPVKLYGNSTTATVVLGNISQIIFIMIFLNNDAANRGSKVNFFNF